MSLQAVVVRTGRSSYGELRRSETWGKLFRAAGGDCRQVGFLSRETTRPNVRALGPVVLGNRVPEVLVWDGASVAERVAELHPDVVILQTARAFQPELTDGPWTTVLDLVDRLSLSYLQRAGLSRGPRSIAYAALAARHAGFEAAAARTFERVVAAGRSDALALGAHWMPNLVDPAPCPPERGPQPFDAVFFGSLGYRPNVEALEWLARGEPARYGLRVLVAGHAPTDHVRRLCADQDWVLEENYPDNGWLAERATIAVAPLRSAAGIQNKVIEAAMVGMPQVVTSPALAGLAVDFPARVADTPDAFVAHMVDLVREDATGRDLAVSAWGHTRDHYTVDAWVPALWDLVEGGRTDRPAFLPVARLTESVA